MHRQRPRPVPLDIPSPEEDLCEISMQLDQNDISPYQQRMPHIPSSKQARFDGWIKAEARLPCPQEHSPQPPLDRPPSLPVSRQSIRRRSSLNAVSQQFRAGSSREELRRAYSHELHSQRNTLLLKQSREFYISGESSAALVEQMRQRHRSNEKGSIQRNLIQQVQVQGVNYPILNAASADSPKKMVPHIGKIRHLINAKTKLWP
jgi:hypothetical protein